LVYAGLAVDDAALLAAVGEVAPNHTATPDAMAIAVVMVVVRFAFVAVLGVAYARSSVSEVIAGGPLSVNPVPKATAVCAKRPAEISLYVPEK